MLFTSHPKVILCIFVCLKNIKIGSFQLSSQSAESENKIHSIVNDVQSFKFAYAAEEILKLNDTSKVVRIIHDVYNYEEDNFAKTFQFARALNRVDQIFYALKTLRNELLASGDRDPLKLIPLAKAFLQNVILDNDDEYFESESKKIISEIRADMKIWVAEILSRAMLAKEYYLNANTEYLAEEIYNFDYDVSDVAMRGMVNRTYPFVPAIEIVETIMRSSKFIRQKVSVFLEVFKNLEEDNDLDNKAVIKLASYISQLKEQSNFTNLLHSLKQDVNVMIDKLPTCARNLFFVREVCFWNRGKMEYLYSQNYSSSPSSVYTCAAAALKSEEGSWKVEYFHGDFIFKSLSTSNSDKNEYLGATMHKYDRQARYVETKKYIWGRADLDRGINVWKIELNGEYCFLNNLRFNEYLLASDVKPNKKERFVFSAPAVADIDPNNYQWQIRDCS